MAHTEVYTRFPGPPVPGQESNPMYSAQEWVRVQLFLETAGPVSVGTRVDLFPVLSGKGILLPPSGEPVKLLLPKGDRLYIAAEAINRVKFIVEPIPFLEKIALILDQGFGGLKGLLGAALRKRGQKAPAKDEPFCPPPPSVPPNWRG